MGRGALVALLLLSLPALAQEGVVRGQVEVLVEKDGKRTPKADRSRVVVYLVGFTQPASEEVPEMAQKERAFVPDVLPITVGQTVRFPNGDPLLHNVFSRSRAAEFDLGKYRSSDPPKQRRFEKTGVVDVYCDIHENMVATILVLPNRAHAVTDAAGRFTIRGVPPGRWTAFAWLRRGEPVRTEVEVKPGGEAHLTLQLVETRQDDTHLDKHGRPYRKRGGYD